jgi:hypothetical protein
LGAEAEHQTHCRQAGIEGGFGTHGYFHGRSN